MAVAPSHYDDAPHVVELLYRQHATALRSYCRRHVGADDADEVVQTTFLRAIGALNRGERPYAERAWLLTIARNVCASRATSATRRHEQLDPRPLEAASLPVADDLDDLGLGPALRALPDGQRRAFVLRAVHGLSYDEIAAELDVSRAAVESWIFRARRKLATSVGERRRRLALDLSSAAGAAKSLVAANAIKAVAVTAAAGTALTLGPATRDGAPAARAPREALPLQAVPTSPPPIAPPRPTERRERPAPTPAAARATHEPRAVQPDVAAAPAAAVPAATASTDTRPPTARTPLVASPPPAPAEPTTDHPAVPDIAVLEEPVIEPRALDPPELEPLLPTLDPAAVVSALDSGAVLPGLP